MKCRQTETIKTDQLELTVEIYNINYGKGEQLVEKSQSLKEYALFIHEVRRRMHQGTTFRDAVKQAIRHCISNDVMKKFLMEHGSEVENMLYQEWNMERALEIREQEGIEKGMEKGIEKGMEKGIEKGMEKGIEKGMEKLMLSMARKLSAEEIADFTGVALDEVKRILNVSEIRN